MVAAEVATARTYYGDDEGDEEDDAQQDTPIALGAQEDMQREVPDQDVAVAVGAIDAEPWTLPAVAELGAETSGKKADQGEDVGGEERDGPAVSFAWPFPTGTTKRLTGPRPAA